jgi:hypothetical protein
MPFKGGGISTDAKEIKCCQKGTGSTIAETCSDAPPSKKVVERTSERSTDARE